MAKVLGGIEPKEEGDVLDLCIQAEAATTDGIITIPSGDCNNLPKPFLLTVFEDKKPQNPTDFKVKPYKEDEFLPEFTWSAQDGDLWYGFIIVDDHQIDSQYHHSLIHAPLNEDLTNVVSSHTYDETKGWKYSDTSTPDVFGYRYRNTLKTPSGVHAGSALISSGTEKISANGVSLWDNMEGLAGHTKYFDDVGTAPNSYVEFDFNTTAGSSQVSYPVDEMSVVAHITPASYAANRYICSFNEPSDTSTTRDSWGMYLDADGQVNAFVSATPGTTHQTTFVELKSTTKLPLNQPTSVILTVDTQLYQGNVKLYINGRLEDQSGLRASAVSTNNWPTDADGVGGEAIFYDTNGTENLYIGAKSQNSNAGQHSFDGKIEEFTWYDKCIYPIVPQNGKFLLEKPLEELVSGSQTSSSKTWNARLFIKDYHNIRGKTPEEVAASSQISWKKAAFELYT